MSESQFHYYSLKPLSQAAPSQTPVAKAALPTSSQTTSRADLAFALRARNAEVVPAAALQTSSKVERAFALRALVGGDDVKTSRSDRAFALREQHQTS